MNLREALSAALLFIIAFSPLGISQDVPDDVVYTEVKKTLVNGSKGVLTCRFKGAPFAVYWKKGSDPENSPSIITWGYGNKGGPRYEDGSCDIDENYSLIIKNVTYEDEGRYICRVSSYKGVLIHNYTDVTITSNAVKTDQSVLVQKGKVGVLPCEVNIRPRRVSWLRGYNKTLVTMDLPRNVIERGEPGQFNITKDYSLVIYDVAVRHEDEYLCEVADYDTGSTYQDATLLNVFAYPWEPFPSIKECPVTNSPSCTLRILSDTTVTMLTCQVEGYYPQIDLYFVRGAERVETLEPREWNNSDGTLNKRIEIEADGTGETTFECVATGLVGQDDSGSMTIHLVPDNKQSSVVVSVVVPIIFVSAIIVIAVLVFKRRKAPWKQEYKRVSLEPTQKDLISYIEIWMLVKYAVQKKVSMNLAKVLDNLLGDEADSGTVQTEEDYYKKICRWKKECTGVSQRKDFFDACRREGLKAALDQLQEYSDSQREMTSDDLEHTLWHVGGNERITKLLKELGASPEQMDRLQNKSTKDVIVGAMNVLKYWKDVNSTGNQEVMLSLALEKIDYSPKDEDFFRITNGQKRGLDKEEIQTFLPTKVTSRHCTELVDAMIKLKEKRSAEMLLFGSKSKDVWLDDVMKKNRTDLFDSHQMIEDWWAEQNCSNYEKRCRLRRAADGLQDQDMKILTESTEDHKDIYEENSDGKLNDVKSEASGEKWPSTKKLEQIVTLVPESQLMRLWKALKISYDSDHLMYQGKRLEQMCKWRDGIIKLKLEEKYKMLSTALKSIEFDGLLSRPKNDEFIYKAELVDMALGLIMEDFRPFAHALGIKGTRLASYKRAFHPSHLKFGTISLVLQLTKVTESVSLNIKRRPTVLSILNKAGYRKVASRFMFAYEPSYGELFAMEAALTQGDKTKGVLVPSKTTEDLKQAKPAKKSTSNVAAETTLSPSGTDTRGDDSKGDGGCQASYGEIKPDEHSCHNVGTDDGQSPYGAATQSDKPVVDLVSHPSTGDIKTDDQSDNDVATDTEPSPHGAATQGDKSEDNVVPHETTEDVKPSKEQKINVAADAEQFPSSATNKSHGDRKTKILHGNGQKTPRSEATPTSIGGGETQSNYVRDTQGSSGKSVDLLKIILGLTDEDMPENSINLVLVMFKIWKERVCPGLIDHRVVLAEGVKRIGKPHLVPAIMNGGYHTNRTSIEFIKNMLKEMDVDRRSTLRGLLKIKESKKEHPRSSDVMPQAVCVWVAEWTKEMERSTLHKLRDALIKMKIEQHRDFSDKLVDHGFLDLAREIMNIEQYR